MAGTTEFAMSDQTNYAVTNVNSKDYRIDMQLGDNKIESVRDFFAKPIPVWTGTFTTSNVWGDQLLASDIGGLFQAQTIWTEKLKGYLNYRGRVKLRLVINSTPFHAGILRMSYFPCENLLGNEALAHVGYRETASHLPGVLLPMTKNSAELDVPYVGPDHYMSNEVGVLSGSWGKVYVHVFEILRTGTGSNTINCTLWMSVEDFEVAGQIVPQMADTVDKESNGGKGTVSKILDSGARLARDLGAIPTLSSIMGSTTWALKAAGGAASALGWSKPIVDEGPSRVAPSLGWYSANCNTNDVSAPLSVFADNKLRVISDASIAGDQDEMSYNFIKTRWAYSYDFQWTTANAAGAQLTSKTISPTSFTNNVTIGGKTAILAPPFGALGLVHKWYRGSFDVKIMISKTGYHTGTLCITFVPGTTSPTVTLTTGTFAYRTIFDIQDGEEFCFRMPYLLNQDYVDNSTRMGTFYLHVVNPLQAPATVASTVDVMIWVRGGPDLEFQHPMAPRYTALVPQMNDGLVPQGVDTMKTGERVCVTLGPTEPMYRTINSELTIGEHVNHLSHIIKPQWTLYTKNSNWLIVSGLNGATLKPYRYFGYRYNLAGTAWVKPSVAGDMLSFVAPWFAFSRGGLRIRFNMDNTGNTTNILTSQYRAAINDGTSVSSYWDGSNVYINQLYALDIGNTVNNYYSTRQCDIRQVDASVPIQVPFYHNKRYAINGITSDPTSHNDSNFPNTTVSIAGPASATPQVQRSVADDYQLAFFVGIPILIALNSQ